MDQLNVLWIIPYLDRRLVATAAALRERSVEVRIAALQQTPYQLSRLEARETFIGPDGRESASLRAQLQTLVESSAIRIVHATGQVAARIAARIGNRQRNLCLIGEYIGGNASPWYRPPAIGFGYSGFTRVLVREEHHVDLLKRQTGLHCDRIRLIPSGIRPEWYDSPELKCWARGGQPDTFVLGISSEGSSKRNLNLLFAAYNWLPDDADIKLLVIDRNDRCREIANLLHQWPEKVVAGTHIVTDKADPSMFWSVCTASIHFLKPRSRLNQLTDSMAAMAVPVVVCGRNLSVIDDMSTGLSVASADPDSIGQAILFLRRNLEVCRTMAAKARDSAFVEYPFEKSVSALAAMYRLAVNHEEASRDARPDRPGPESNRLHRVSC